MVGSARLEYLSTNKELALRIDLQQTDSLQQCLDKAYADAAKGSSDKVNENLEALAASQESVDSSVEELLASSAYSVGRAAAGFQPGVPAATNGAFRDFGADVKTILKRGSPLIRDAGYAIAAYSVLSDTYSGYEADGVSGAESNLGYSSADAVVDYGLVSSLGPLGIPAAYGLDKVGGSRAVLSTMELQNAIQGCLGMAHIMAPPTP